jgi:hypothetical protein
MISYPEFRAVGVDGKLANLGETIEGWWLVVGGGVDFFM